MPKKGDAAREAVKNKIVEAFGNDFVAIVDKKIYVEAKDGPGGETLQFAIAMTMPKVPVERGDGTAAADNPTGPANAAPVELSPEDKAAVERLKARLGIAEKF